MIAAPVDVYTLNIQNISSQTIYYAALPTAPNSGGTQALAFDGENDVFAIQGSIAPSTTKSFSISLVSDYYYYTTNMRVTTSSQIRFSTKSTKNALEYASDYSIPVLGVWWVLADASSNDDPFQTQVYDASTSNANFAKITSQGPTQATVQVYLQ